VLVLQSKTKRIAKTDRSLEGSGEEITWQKGNRLTDLPGRVSPWNGQSGPPREADQSVFCNISRTVVNKHEEA